MLQLLAGTPHVPTLLYTSPYYGPQLPRSKSNAPLPLSDVHYTLTTPVGSHLTSDNPTLILKVAADIASVIGAMADKGCLHRSE
jgi:hypothetical protein